MKNPDNIPDPSVDFRERLDVTEKRNLFARGTPRSESCKATAFFERSEKKGSGAHTAGAGRKLRPCDYPRLNPVARAYLILELISTNKPVRFIALKFAISERQVQRYARQIRARFHSQQLSLDLISYDKNGNLLKWKE